MQAPGGCEKCNPARSTGMDGTFTRRSTKQNTMMTPTMGAPSDVLSNTGTMGHTTKCVNCAHGIVEEEEENDALLV